MRPLIDVANVEQDMMRILSLPSADLRHTAGQPAKIAFAFIGGRRQNVPVQVSRVENGNSGRPVLLGTQTAGKGTAGQHRKKAAAGYVDLEG